MNCSVTVLDFVSCNTGNKKPTIDTNFHSIYMPSIHMFVSSKRYLVVFHPLFDPYVSLFLISWLILFPKIWNGGSTDLIQTLCCTLRISYIRDWMVGIMKKWWNICWWSKSLLPIVCIPRREGLVNILMSMSRWKTMKVYNFEYTEFISKECIQTYPLKMNMPRTENIIKFLFSFQQLSAWRYKVCGYFGLEGRRTIVLM